ncbi:MAG: hypothetical protein C4520_07120 [Candidatus Abyssobacteria bacterium SURF_5]|uniref:Uncharacterized protein n=1 Tax=Abyssobacteria bacterium (strain SURF_5) TaxID=2093360 RepID=A0A3A4P0Y1_ABYX5|nr:MAG: hypothetical protein C4520_07120 [Candidatus Abyssubacteria bacterium SURF_5]
MILIIALGIILALLIAVSIWFAYSGYVEGRTTIGWVFLFIFLIVYVEFSGLLYARTDDAAGLFVLVLSMILILMTQGPLLFELISLGVMPNPARDLKVIKSYAKAERKVAEEDVAGAIAEYEIVIADDPHDVTARFRLADLRYQAGDYRKAVEAYAEIAALTEKLDMNQRCSALMRLSEIHAQNLGDPENARKYLNMIINEYAGSKFAGYAMDRLNQL